MIRLFLVAFAAVQLFALSAEARYFYRSEWTLSFDYRNAYTGRVPMAATLSGKARFSDDGAFCELIVQDKIFSCTLKEHVDFYNAYDSADLPEATFLEIIELYSVRGPEKAEEALRVIKAHYMNNKTKLAEIPVHDFGFDFPRALVDLQLIDPNSNYEAVQMYVQWSKAERY